MVRDVGGTLSFVVDAVECCCDGTYPPTTTSTTTAGPTTTTGVPTTTTGEPAFTCPTDAWKLANCPTPLYVYVATGDCDQIDCGGTYTLTYGVGTGVWWFDGVGYCHCEVYLDCLAAGPPYRWYLNVSEWCGANRLGYCTWVRPVYVDDCPMGVYSAHTEYLCDGCSPTVTVYS